MKLRGVVLGGALALCVAAYVAVEEYSCRHSPVSEEQATALAIQYVGSRFKVAEPSSIATEAVRDPLDGVWHVSAKYERCEVLVAVMQCKGIDVAGFNEACISATK